MNSWRTQLPRRQNGLTLVELMVALTISLIIMAGVGQIFTSNRESYRLQAGMGRLQENARFALDLLRRDVSMAGFSPTNFGINTALVAPQAIAGADPASDMIAVQYTAATDCLGQATPTGTAVNQYYIADPDGDGVSSLMCLGNGSAIPAAVIDGVDNMQVLYGEDFPSPNPMIPSDHSVDQFVSIPTGGLPITTPAVIAVRIGLLMNTVEPVSRTLDTGNYYFLNSASLGPFNDFRRRRVYTTTINLRNVM